MSFELFHGICEKVPSLVPGLATPKGKRRLCSLNRLVETVLRERYVNRMSMAMGWLDRR